MKTSTLFATLGLLAGVVSAEPISAVEVEFLHADKFTDFSDSYYAQERGRAALVRELTQFIERKAERRLAPGERLEVVITDIDMAGEFEPWRGPSAQDIRIVKDLYPPRIDLTFRVTNAVGEVIFEGERKLRDLGFMYTVRPTNSDTLRYEKELIDRWLSREFRRTSAA